MNRIAKLFLAFSFCVALLAILLANERSRGNGIAYASPKNAPSAAAQIYLPFIQRQQTAVVSTSSRRINAPYFSGTVPFSQTAVFWFGRVNQTENYTDVRIGYNDSELYVHTTTIDRLLWYNPTPTTTSLTAWDSVSLYLNLSGVSGTAPSANSFRFDAQPSWSEPRTNYQAAYRGNGSTWVPISASITTTPGWRGDWNNNLDDKGWAMGFDIPFSSLGLSGMPLPQSQWGLAVVLHDRDDLAGTAIPDKSWPETVSPNIPSTWGQLVFGLSTFTPSPATPGAVVVIRNKLNGVTVVDRSVGGDKNCGAGRDYWTQWGDTPQSYYNPELTDFNVQNQSDVSDYVCFAKDYMMFPLNTVPSGKVIISATLTLHQIGNSGGPGQSQSSLMQIMTVNVDWTSSPELTWNNAPLAAENVSQAWIDPYNCAPAGTMQWPCIARKWNVSRAVAQAYTAGKPLSLAIYSADSDYHSGKYFIGSNTGDWNWAGRPMLEILWGNP
jgi:hypothetical protein